MKNIFPIQNMPIYHFRDSVGNNYYQFGPTGAKYYFDPDSKSSITKAYNKCLKQAKAIKASQAKASRSR